MESKKKLDNTSIKKQYQQYLIKLSSDSGSINITIEKDNTIYESNFNLQSLHQHQLLMKSLTTQEIIKFIIELIDMNKIEIKEENMNLKLILISTHSNIELNLQKKNIISNEMKLKGFHFIKDKHKIELKSCNLKILLQFIVIIIVLLQYLLFLQEILFLLLMINQL